MLLLVTPLRRSSWMIGKTAADVSLPDQNRLGQQGQNGRRSDSPALCATALGALRDGALGISKPTPVSDPGIEANKPSVEERAQLAESSTADLLHRPEAATPCRPAETSCPAMSSVDRINDRPLGVSIWVGVAQLLGRRVVRLANGPLRAAGIVARKARAWDARSMWRPTTG